MGVLNVTPDSFADGGLHRDAGRAVAHAEAMIADGADIVDIGGESTRPGAPPIDGEEEWRRIGPVLSGLRARTTLPISVDTYKAAVAERAIAAGADIINDISGLSYDADLPGVIASNRVAIVLMHMRGRSADMYAHANYGDVMKEIVKELAGCLGRAANAGIALERTIVDPGLGFAKRPLHSLEALRRLPELAVLGRPILSGPSRKSFLSAAVGERPAQERIWATAGAVALSVALGAHIVRVHDVGVMVDVVRTADAIVSGVSTL